ncbi:MAG: Hsp70 family protein [Acidimicrobiales bacterium]
MTYYLGIDLGTTFTAAAVWRDGRVEIASLGSRAPVIPSVVLLRDDGTLLTGDAAARRAVTEPERIAREFKRRFGDPTPIMVGGTPYSPDALTARLLAWVVDHVSEREGERPAGTTVSHPANWGPFKLDLLRQVFRMADAERVSTITEPEAAAIHYASQERVEVGSTVAVYDLGGGTFDAAVLRRTTSGWEVLGAPEGVERLGGIDFDQAVFHHVSSTIGSALDDLDPADPTAVTAMARLRQECVDAKEALASDVDVTIPVLLPNIQTEVRLTRSELEGMIRPALADSIGALRRALASANVAPESLQSVLLVGGSSRLPLVAQLVGSELRRPVAVDAHPKHGVALGAAIVAAERGAGHSLDTEIVPTIETINPQEVIAPRPAPAGTGPAAVAGAAAATAPTGPAGPETVEAPPPGPVTPPGGAIPVVASEQAAAGSTTQAQPRVGGSPPPPTVHVPAPPVRRTSQTAQTAPSSPPRGTGSAGSGSGSGGGRTPSSGASRSRPVAAVVGGLVAAGLLVAAGIYLTNDNGDDDTTTADNTETTTTEAPTTSSEPPATTTTEPPVTGPAAALTGVSLIDGTYAVEYTWDGFEPDVEGGPDSLHFHFFLNTIEPQNAGTNGNPPGEWELTDAPGQYTTSYSPENRGEATQMCVVVATNAHAVYDPGSGNCVDLPQ